MSTDDDSRELPDAPPTERSLRVPPPDTTSFAERYAPLLEPTLIHRVVPRPEVTPAPRESSKGPSVPKKMVTTARTKRLALVAVVVAVLAALGVVAGRARGRGTSDTREGSPGLAANGPSSATPASVPSAASPERDEEPIDPQASSEWLDDETLGRILEDDEFAPSDGARTEADLVARAEREQVRRATDAVNAGMFGEAAEIYAGLSAMRPDVSAYSRSATILAARSVGTGR